MKNLFFNNFWSTIKLLGSRGSFQPAVSSSFSNEPASKVCYADDGQINPEYRMDQTEYKGIKNIIFDLGNVIVDLDIPKSDQLLSDLTGSSYHGASEEELKVFHDFETGDLSEDLFLNYFIGKSDGRAQAIDVINAWNAMLVNIPWPRLEMMRKLKETYQVFILSNTNETHIRWTNHYIQTRYREAGFKSFVHHALYSHILGARKPDEIIFNKVLETYQLVPQETIFFDDNFDNIQAAKQLGIQAIQVHPADEILDIVGRLPTPHVSKKVP